MKTFDIVCEFIKSDIKEFILKHWYPISGFLFLFFIFSLISGVFFGRVAVSIMSFMGVITGGAITYFVEFYLIKNRQLENYRVKLNMSVISLLDECEVFLDSNKELLNNFESILDREMEVQQSGPDEDAQYRLENIESKIANGKRWFEFFRNEKLDDAFLLPHLCETVFKDKATICECSIEIKNMVKKYFRLVAVATYHNDYSELYKHVGKLFELLKEFKSQISNL